MANNADYPEVSCTVSHNGDETTISGEVGGTSLSATENDPRCFDILYPQGSVCRRICGALPPGRDFDAVVTQTIAPGDYARFAELEVYQDKDPVRICFRVKNWAQHTTKQFTVVVRHKPKA